MATAKCDPNSDVVTTSVVRTGDSYLMRESKPAIPELEKQEPEIPGETSVITPSPLLNEAFANLKEAISEKVGATDPTQV